MSMFGAEKFGAENGNSVRAAFRKVGSWLVTNKANLVCVGVGGVAAYALSDPLYPMKMWFGVVLGGLAKCVVAVNGLPLSGRKDGAQEKNKAALLAMLQGFAVMTSAAASGMAVADQARVANNEAWQKANDAFSKGQAAYTQKLTLHRLPWTNLTSYEVIYEAKPLPSGGVAERLNGKAVRWLRAPAAQL